MESQLQHTHGGHYDDDKLHHTGHDHYEDEHHGEKKSVIKKVKEKAKKIKNTITKHGHGHGDHEHHHHDDEDDDDDEETVEDPEVHGAPMYDSARVGHGGLDTSLPQARGNLERPEDRYSDPVIGHSVPPHGTNLSQASGLGHNQAYCHHETNQEKWRNKVGQPIGMEEQPFGPNPTRMTSPIGTADHLYGTRVLPPEPAFNHGAVQDVNQGGLRGIIGKTTKMDPDPNAPRDPLISDPSNYGSKVTNPTHLGGKEAELSQLQHSLDKMGIESEPKTYNPNHPENLPHDTLTGNPSSQTSSYTEKISSSASAIADKAVAAKDAIASKLGYSDQNPTTKSHEPTYNSASATDYAHKITDKVTEALAPVYEKVVDAGSSVMSKVQGNVSGTGQQQVHGGSDEMVTDKGVSVKESLVETLKPGEEDKALSDVITHALHRGSEESAKKHMEDKPMGTVTESFEVRSRLGTGQHEEHDQGSGNVVAEKNMSDRVRDAVGSWFGGKGDAPQGTLGTSYVTDEGLTNNPTGDQNRGSGREQ
ncbi:low-temperature-induced 65 kDa protein-like [Bidens hawaiensis]|uniref:low-temperature-induced 65 kDa protein-like n=1 Tax=Bidens hawaiensis TaxID=980011 RepID=UPI00404B40B8